jgi:hypothetical protein
MWSVELHINDCDMPATNLAGADITGPGIPANTKTDANGNYLYREFDDLKHQVTVQIALLGYIAKSFNILDTQIGTVQTVCLNPSPKGTTDPNTPTGRGPNGNGCFIVSAATGSSESVEIIRMRTLRDRIAAVSRLADGLIDLIYADYYTFSPEIAAELNEDRASRNAVLLVIVRPLFAWYTLAGLLALERADAKTLNRASQDVLKACPRYLGRRSIASLLEKIQAGGALPANYRARLGDFAPRIRRAARLRFASWAILAPLARAWRSSADGLDLVEEVGQWLASAPLDALSPPNDPGLLDAELRVLANFLHFAPKARRQLGERLAAAWPDAASGLQRAGFLSQTLIKERE